jgi:hypothetical protein
VQCCQRAALNIEPRLPGRPLVVTGAVASKLALAAAQGPLTDSQAMVTPDCCCVIIQHACVGLLLKHHTACRDVTRCYQVPAVLLGLLYAEQRLLPLHGWHHRTKRQHAHMSR